MAIIQCPECGKKVSTRASECPHCGYPMPHENNEPQPFQQDKNPKKSKSGLIIGIIAAVLVAAIGLCYFFGAWGDVNDIEHPYESYTYEELLPLAEKNDLEAITQIGRIYARNEDWESALSWSMKAAKQGYTVAECNVGVCYTNLGDTENAIIWYKKAADKGLYIAMNALAEQYYSIGEWEKGYEWAKKSADKKDAEGYWYVAIYYHYHKQDVEKAIEYYTKTRTGKNPWDKLIEESSKRIDLLSKEGIKFEKEEDDVIECTVDSAYVDSAYINLPVMESTLDSLAMRTYTGGGYGGGISTDLTVEFLRDGKCICTSDFYQAYSRSDALSVDGSYSTQNGKVIVRCKPPHLDNPIVWEFEVSDSGHTLSYDNSVSGCGTAGVDYMSIHRNS